MGPSGPQSSPPSIVLVRYSAIRYSPVRLLPRLPTPATHRIRSAIMRIVTGYPVEPRHLDQIAAAAPGAEVIDAGQRHIPTEILNADVFCGHAKEEPVAWDEVVRRGRLRWIQSSAAGLDHCLTPEVIASDIQVTSASGLFADQVAEQALALLLGLLRGLPVFFRAAEKREFLRRPTGDLHGATVGIIGFGGNGRHLAKLLAAFRTRILATDVFPVDCPPYVERLLSPEGMREVLAESDVVILCVPLNDTTRGMFDATTLAQMKPGSILINVARGKVVVEDALVRALESQHLKGAGLDVTEIEPLPESSRLWDMPQVIITPHVGAQSRHRYDDVTDFFCRNLAQMQAGRPLLNLVDKHLGFPRREAHTSS
jgi:phosphoglycerate dehydrogenase-like enzyme